MQGFRWNRRRWCECPRMFATTSRRARFSRGIFRSERCWLAVGRQGGRRSWRFHEEDREKRSGSWLEFLPGRHHISATTGLERSDALSLPSFLGGCQLPELLGDPSLGPLLHTLDHLRYPVYLAICQAPALAAGTGANGFGVELLDFKRGSG